MPKFIHDSIKHTYSLGGRPMISTTDVLRRIGLSPDYGFVEPSRLEESRQIGVAVAEATALLDQGKDWKKYDALSGYVRAWQKFKKEMKFRPTIIEQPLYDPEHLFASRPDRFGPSKLGKITVQLKTGKVAPCVGLQTAAEERIIKANKLCDEPYPTSMLSSRNRFGVHLKYDGTYDATRFNDPMDLRVFLSALATAKWLINH